MIIERITEDGSVILAVSGELTALTSEQLGSAVKTAIAETGCLVLDFTNLEYLASAGLRVLLDTKKLLDAKNGSFIVRNVSQTIMRTFEITGFSDILDFE